MTLNGEYSNGSQDAPAPRVLVVEDDDSLRHLIFDSLDREGFALSLAATGEEALALAQDETPDVILLDLMLPGIDGFEVCRRLRAEPMLRDISVLILTALDGESDVVAGLEVGADDYLTKPFSPRILVARIRAALRRRSPLQSAGKPSSLTVAGIALDRDRHEVLFEDQRIDLTVTEFEILWLLASDPGRVFTRARIVEATRGVDSGVTERSVDVRLVGLRRKLGPAAGCIETVRGVGYRLSD